MARFNLYVPLVCKLDISIRDYYKNSSKQFLPIVITLQVQQDTFKYLYSNYSELELERLGAKGDGVLK